MMTRVIGIQKEWVYTPETFSHNARFPKQASFRHIAFQEELGRQYSAQKLPRQVYAFPTPWAPW